MITDTHRVQALDIFMTDENTAGLTKDELITGIKTILNQKTLYPESERLTKLAEKKINEKRGVL